MTFLLDIFNLSLKNLARRKLRSWLTILGIVIGISSMIALISLSYGMENSLKILLTKMGKDKLFILPGRVGGFFSSAFIGRAFTEAQVDKIKKLKDVEEVVPIIMASGNVKFLSESTGTTLIGISTDARLYKVGFEIEKGRYFKKTDDGKCNVILGYTFAKKAFSKEIKVGDKLIINGHECKVIGIFKPTGSQFDDLSIYVPLETMKTLFGAKEIKMILVKAKDVEKAKEEIRKLLKRIRGEDFTIMTMGQMLQYAKQILSIVSVVVMAIATISILISAIGIMNTMYMAITERIKEIGILKAIGAKKWEIALMFIFESGLIGLAGGIFGTILGVSISLIVKRVANIYGLLMFRPQISIEFILFVILFSFIVGILSGIAPALSAAKLDPIKALRSE